MRWRPVALAASIALMALPAGADPAPPRQDHRVRRFRVIPRAFHGPVIRAPRSPPLLIEPPDRFMPPGVERPSPLKEDQIPSPAPLSHGFHLTVPLDTPLPAPPSRLDRAFEVGKALGACWVPPADFPWTIITVRLSFKRDGSVNGEPRVPYADAGSPRRNSDLAHSLLAALKHCTPLAFSPSLGSAIAGEIFAISFTHQDQR